MSDCVLVLALNKGLFLSAVIFELSVCGVSDGYLKSRIVLPLSLRKWENWEVLLK